MDAAAELHEHIGPFTEWADILAECYVMLKTYVSDEGAFIAGYYGQNRNNGVQNPNLEKLRALEDTVRHAVCDDLEDRLLHERAIDAVIQALTNVSLDDYGDEALNEATVLWSTIKGIDGAYSSCDLSEAIELRGPINTAHIDDVGVYFHPLVWTPLRLSYRNARASAVPESGLNKALGAFIIYEKERGRDLPVVTLADAGVNESNLLLAMEHAKDLAKAERTNAKLDQRDGETVVSIGLELFTGADMLKGYASEGPLLCMKGVMGSAFGVRYAADYVETVSAIIRESIDSAIAQGCQILVFPEFVVSPQLSKRISQLLRDEQRCGKLSIVVAGSGWIECDGGGDNVCHLYDGFGKHLGTYHKCSPFLIGAKGEGLYEALSHPGLTCTIVDVKGVGRVLPSICKDLGSIERYTTRLATTFDSDLVCAPAYSTSLRKAFEDQLHTLANRAYSHTIVCNLCGAREEYLGKGEQSTATDGTLEVTLVGHPEPSSDNPNNIVCDYKGISRSRRCRERCVADYVDRRSHSCLHVVRIAVKHLEDGTDLSVEEPVYKRKDRVNY